MFLLRRIVNIFLRGTANSNNLADGRENLNVT